MSDIIILANFCFDFSENDNGRFLYLANMLAKKHNVEIITSDFYHTEKRMRKKAAAKWPFKITFLHELGYSRNVCLKRFYSHYVWGKNVKAYLEKRKKPDVIYCAVPSLSAPLAAAKYCEKRGIRFIIDVQDLWPEAFQMVVNIPVISDIAFLPFRKMADGIYKRADAVCAVSQTYVDRALRVNRKCDHGESVFLGTNLETFDNNAANNSVSRDAEDELRLAYCGTLGSSYDLTCVIDALYIVKKKGVQPPKFIVMGDGPDMERFRKYSAEKGVDAEFVGRVPYDKMCGILKSCDITVNPITTGAAQSIINKHADYAASGLPVLNTQESKEYRRLVKNYRMGFNCKNGDAEDLAEKMTRLIGDPQLRKEMGKNARRCAEELFDRSNSYLRIINLIEKE
jgi:glycosyltransferase involved in cell wall biosynthesis